MTLKQKILANVKEQGLVNARMGVIQRQFDELKSRNERLNGGLDILQQFLQEEVGMGLTEYFEKDPEFKEQVDKAVADGEALAVSGASSVPPGPVLDPNIDTSTGAGIVRHDGNKKVAALPQTVPGPTPTELSAVASRTNSGTRKPPVVIVDDLPPAPETESREDARDPTPV